MKTNNQLLALDKILGKYAKLPSVQWRYCVARNLVILRPLIEAFQKALPVSEDLKTFEQEKNKIYRSKKEEEEKKADFDALKAKFPEIEKDYDIYLKAERELLDVEVDVEFYKMLAKNLPGWNNPEASTEEDPENPKTISLQDMVYLIDLGVLCDSFEQD